MGIEELKRRIREESLVINRIPKITKKNFLALASAEFCNDYGSCIKFLLDQAIEYQSMKSIFFENIKIKLDEIANLLNTKSPKEIEEVKLLSGKIIKKEVKNE